MMHKVLQFEKRRREESQVKSNSDWRALKLGDFLKSFTDAESTLDRSFHPI